MRDRLQREGERHASLRARLFLLLRPKARRTDVAAAVLKRSKSTLSPPAPSFRARTAEAEYFGIVLSLSN